MRNLLLILAIGCVFSCTTDNISTNIESNNTKCNHGEKIQFPSLDSLTIYANLYHNDNQSPVIVLCHQAGFNKFEYGKIAKTLNSKGYNCIAIDQRSGGNVIESFNETFLEAKEKEGITTLIGNISTSTIGNSNLVMDVDPKKEINNEIPETNFPFDLKENEAVLSYLEKGVTKFYKVKNIKKTDTNYR